VGQQGWLASQQSPFDGAYQKRLPLDWKADQTKAIQMRSTKIAIGSQLLGKSDEKLPFVANYLK
jgi:hypothetical protein